MVLQWQGHSIPVRPRTLTTFTSFTGTLEESIASYVNLLLRFAMDQVEGLCVVVFVDMFSVLCDSAALHVSGPKQIAE